MAVQLLEHGVTVYIESAVKVSVMSGHISSALYINYLVVSDQLLRMTLCCSITYNWCDMWILVSTATWILLLYITWVTSQLQSLQTQFFVERLFAVNLSSCYTSMPRNMNIEIQFEVKFISDSFALLLITAFIGKSTSGLLLILLSWLYICST
jgi:hypothetical protein